MTQSTSDPRSIAYAVAVEAADEQSHVGDFVDVHELGDGVSDFRFEANIPGYEDWQWSVTLYHDAELDTWTVDESSLIPTEKSLMPPKWIPWKDRLLPSDLAVTDALGTEPDDERLEAGIDKSSAVDELALESAAAAQHAEEADRTEATSVAAETASDKHADAIESAEADETTETTEEASDAADSIDAQIAKRAERTEIAEEYELSRRRVLTSQGRAQAAERWYAGPHGPKSLSTKTAGGLACQTCGFFIPLQGELNLMFGICANKWSPDDGRVVSRDHGCGEHSEIEPPQPSRLWVQSKPAFDDMHIDIVAQKPRDERGDIEAIENALERNSNNRADDQEDQEDRSAQSEVSSDKLGNDNNSEAANSVESNAAENAETVEADEVTKNDASVQSEVSSAAENDVDHTDGMASEQHDDGSEPGEDDIHVDDGMASESADDDESDDEAMEADILANTIPENDDKDLDEDDTDDVTSIESEVIATIDVSVDEEETPTEDDEEQA